MPEGRLISDAPSLLLRPSAVPGLPRYKFGRTLTELKDYVDSYSNRDFGAEGDLEGLMTLTADNFDATLAKHDDITCVGRGMAVPGEGCGMAVPGRVAESCRRISCCPGRSSHVLPLGVRPMVSNRRD